MKRCVFGFMLDNMAVSLAKDYSQYAQSGSVLMAQGLLGFNQCHYHDF